MKVRIKGASNLAAQLKGELASVRKELLQEVGQAQIANMQLRAQDGIGLDDRRMLLYSKAYAAKRARSGRTVKKRTLNMSGRMLRSMRAKVYATGVTISFSDRASLKKAQHTHRQTPWFGVSPGDARVLDYIVSRRLRLLRRR